MFDNRWIILQISVWCLKRKKIYEIEAGVALFTLLPLQTFYNVGPNTKKRFITLARTLKKFPQLHLNILRILNLLTLHIGRKLKLWFGSQWLMVVGVVVVVVLVVIDCSTVVIAFTRHLWGRGFDSIFHHAEVDIKWTVKRSTNVTMFKRTQFESRLLQKILLLS